MADFAVITFVGPGETEAHRLSRMLAGLAIYEPDVNFVVIIDDNSRQHFGKIIPAPLVERSIIRPNPRNGSGHWWSGGLCVALLEGLRWISEETNADFIVRLDTDSLVVNSFSERLRDRFERNTRIGLLGTWDQYPLSSRQRLPHPDAHEIVKSIVLKAARHTTIWRHSDHPLRFQCALRQNDRRIRRLVQLAIKHGYIPGYYIQGGGYALHRRVIASPAVAPLIVHPLTPLHQLFGEDVLATLLCYATCHSADNMNAMNEVFAVQNNGLPDTPESLKNSRLCILHSCKNDPTITEDEIYHAFFQEH